MSSQKEKPIIFSSVMVRSILDNRKTQTRRVVKPQPEEGDGYHYWWRGDWDTRGGPRAGVCTHGTPGNGEATWPLKEIAEHCPYGEVGDKLWVREQTYQYGRDTYSMMSGYHWIPDDSEPTLYAADKPNQNARIFANSTGDYYHRSIPSIHMKKELCRIFLKITNIKVERVQDITLADIKAEGLSIDRIFQETKDAWIELWDSLNAKPKPVLIDEKIAYYVSYPWEDIQETKTYRGKMWYIYGNPLVWIVEFKKQLLERK